MRRRRTCAVRGWRGGRQVPWGNRSRFVEDMQRPRMEAARLLERLRDRAIDTPAQATPVDALAEMLGLDVAPFHPATRRKGTLGWLEPGENLIFLSDGLTEPVRRFT